MHNIKSATSYAELNIFGKNIDVVKVSKELEMEIDCELKWCDYSCLKENAVSVKPATNNEENSLWTYKTTERETIELANQLDELIDIFNEKIDKLVKVKNTYNCEIDVCIVLYNNKQKTLPGISLNQKQIQFLEKIGDTIDYDIYL